MTIKNKYRNHFSFQPIVLELCRHCHRCLLEQGWVEIKIAVFIFSMTPNFIKIGLCPKELWNVKEYKVDNKNPTATRKLQGITSGLGFLQLQLWTSSWESRFGLEPVMHDVELQVNARLTRLLGMKLIYRKSVFNIRHCDRSTLSSCMQGTPVSTTKTELLAYSIRWQKNASM